MMLQLVLAYLFAAGMGLALVYMARQNRKQGWERPASRWFGVELQPRQSGTPAMASADSASPELLPELLQLHRELAAHGTPIRPQVESSEVESVETPELVSTRRI